MTRPGSRIFDPNHRFVLVRQSAASVAILKDALLNADLSFKARGLLGALLCLPESEPLRFDAVLNLSTPDGRDAVRSGLRDLQRAGHLQIIQERNEAGRFERTVWYVSDTKFNLPAGSFDPQHRIAVNGKAAPGEVDRKTGFPFTVDPSSSCSSKFFKTTTTAVEPAVDTPAARGIEDLIFPAQLSGMDRRGIEQLVQQCPEAAQALLDELAGAIACGAIKSSPAGYLRSLVKAQKDGTFKPDRGLAIAKRRSAEKSSNPASPRLGTKGVEIAKRNLSEINQLLAKSS